MLIDACHRKGLGVLLDWVPGHFPDDPHGLGHFDGTALYEHANPMQGRHLDWGTLIYNYGRVEVTNFLMANALFWLERYGIDGLRVDAVASMIYLDYSRPAGGWIPNRYGGRENIDAIEFLRRTNTQVFARHPDATTIAEESTAWPMVSRPVDWGGLGFGYKWNMGWMHDTLDYISKEPIHRRHHHGSILFGLHYAFFGEFRPAAVARRGGARQTLDPRPHAGRRMAALRQPARLLRLHVRPSRQEADVHGLRVRPGHRVEPRPQPAVASARPAERISACSGSCAISTGSIATTPALHQLDCEAAGFEWLVTDDANHSVFAWLRKGNDPKARCVVVVNFTPEVRRNYRVRVPFAGHWREALNTDAAHYGGSNTGNAGAVSAVVTPESPELHLVLPPLAAVYLVPEV